ncbi:hypothetical protein QL285_065606 [Trifolium repens]|nr:hypothetical protein QL285_065606 [Trifolium repens]
MAWRKALLPLLAKLEEEEKDKVAKLEEEKVNVTEHEKLKVKVPRSIKELILVLYMYRIMVSIRCSKMSDLAIRRRYISDEAYNSEGGKVAFGKAIIAEQMALAAGAAKKYREKKEVKGKLKRGLEEVVEVTDDKIPN